MNRFTVTGMVLIIALMLPLSVYAEMPDAPEKVTLSTDETGRDEHQPPIIEKISDITDSSSEQRTATPSEEQVPIAIPADAPVTLNEASQPPSEENPDENAAEDEVSDPLEPINRAVFVFNDKLYSWVLKPASTGYNMVVPEPARVAVRNLYTNASMPMRFLGSLMQGKFVAAGTELARFTLNTTIGLAGLFDVAADHFGLQAHMEDLGQTFGYYGIGNGPYLVLPFLGPSTLRDTVGLAGDALIYPLGYIEPVEAMLGVLAYDKLNRASLSIGEYDDWKNASLDFYTSMKDAYVKRRKILIKE